MKRLIFFSVVICVITVNSVLAQKSGFLKNVTNSVKSELLGTPEPGSNQKSTQPEPSCACDPAILILELGGKLQLDYSEISINTRDDGSIMIKDRISNNFYVSKEGVLQGPMQAGDKRLAGFEDAGASNENEDKMIGKYGKYISKTGDKYTINFGGKTFGPYSLINDFAVSKSKEKFAALVTENTMMTEDQGKKMEAAIKNAKTDQERMDLAMKYSQMMSDKMMQGGGPSSIVPKLITNIAGANYDFMQGMAILNGEMKYDDILISKSDGVYDLLGKKIITIRTEHLTGGQIFINSANTKYAVLTYGELIFSDSSTKLTDFFNPYISKIEGKIYLTYMYYSPKKNAIMQCKIPF